VCEHRRAPLAPAKGLALPCPCRLWSIKDRRFDGVNV
jgi:hypothetical protein